jgi:autophagy-related protein 9
MAQPSLSSRMSSSRSKSGQSSLAVSGGSQQILNTMMNPLKSAYHGYIQANQSVAEEEEYGHAEAAGVVDLEAGRSFFHSTQHTGQLSPKAQGKRRVAWDGRTSEMKTLHPNIHKEDKIHEPESSDDEVPQSFKVEVTGHSTQSVKRATEQNIRKGRASYSTTERKLPPTDESPLPVSAETISDEHRTRASLPDQGSPLPSQPRTFMRGLDDYEKALWNWVNVYNLDAFLQEVYYYYDGKGIYSIALARGLNLL